MYSYNTYWQETIIMARMHAGEKLEHIYFSLAATHTGEKPQKIATAHTRETLDHRPVHVYSLIQKKCQGGNKCVLPITVKFDQSTRRFGRISFARSFKLTKHTALLFSLVILSLVTTFIVI